MKRRIISIVALLAVMAAMTGVAAAGDIILIDQSTGKELANPIDHVVPGQDFHLHANMPVLDAGNVAAGATYIYHVTVTPLFGGGKASDITIHRGAIHDPAHLLDGQTIKPTSPSFMDPEEIHWEVSKDAPFDAQYNVHITLDTVNPQPPTTRPDPQSASRSLIIISPNTMLTKTANPSNGTAPLTVTYTYTEKNTGDVNLTNVKVTDDALTVTPVTQAPPNQAFNIGDVNKDGLLNPGETWTFTSTTTFNSPGTFTNVAHGHGNPIVNNTIFQDIDITDPKFPGEVASATVNVTIPPPCVSECKFKAWGLLGPRADPEKTFEIFAYNKFMPSGKVSVIDHKKNLDIEATSITSVVTTEHTGTAEGFATVNGAGNFPFTVSVTDATVDPKNAPLGTFTIDLPTYPYHNSGPLSFGVVSIIKF